MARIEPQKEPIAPNDAAINESGKGWLIEHLDWARTNYNSLTNINKACSQD